MNRFKLLKHLNREGCVLFREGVKHSVFYNPETNQTYTVPRHNEIDDFLAKKIYRDLGISQI